jgi:hypothetical protein
VIPDEFIDDSHSCEEKGKHKDSIYSQGLRRCSPTPHRVGKERNHEQYSPNGGKSTRHLFPKAALAAAPMDHMRSSAVSVHLGFAARGTCPRQKNEHRERNRREEEEERKEEGHRQMDSTPTRQSVSLEPSV